RGQLRQETYCVLSKNLGLSAFRETCLRDPRDAIRPGRARMWVVGREQPDVVAQHLDSVLEVVLPGIDGAKEPTFGNDFRGLSFQERRHPRARTVRVVKLLDKPGHPATATLEDADSEPRKEIEDAAANQSRRGSLPAPAVVDGV